VLAVFPTCLVEYQQPQIGHDLVKVYERNGVECSIAEGAGCCGAPWLHSGDMEQFTKVAEKNVKALAASVRDAVKENGGEIVSTEGEDVGEWVLVDCGDAVVHIMQPAIRSYYTLEEIWGDKPVRVKLASEETAAARKAALGLDNENAVPARKTAAKKTTKKAAAEPAGKEPAAKKTAARKTATKTAAKTGAKAPAKTASAKSAKATPAKTAARKTGTVRHK